MYRTFWPVPAVELASNNIPVNAIALGWIATEMTAPARVPMMTRDPTAGFSALQIVLTGSEHEENMTIPYPHIPSIIVSFGPLAVRWYGVMYAIGYVLGYRLVRTRTAQAILPMERTDLDSWIGYLVIGMLVGARPTYAVVYDRPAFARDAVDLNGELYGRASDLPSVGMPVLGGLPLIFVLVPRR